MDQVVSTAAAVASALLFAITTNVQRATAAAVPSVGTGPLHLVRRLVTDRRWLAGSMLGAVALGLHALALARGSVTVVQSTMTLGLVAALSVEAWRERRPLRWHESGGAVLVMIGVATVAAVGRPAPAGAASAGWAAAVGLAVASGALAAVIRSRHGVGTRWGARLLAAAGGACFAVDAVFLQRLATTLDARAVAGPRPGPALWLSVAADLAGFLGVAMIGGVAVQRAYQVAPLRAVQPVLAAAEPVTAFLVGVTVLHEDVSGGAAGYAVLVAGLAAITGGIFTGLGGARWGARRAAQLVLVDGDAGRPGRAGRSSSGRSPAVTTRAAAAYSTSRARRLTASRSASADSPRTPAWVSLVQTLSNRRLKVAWDQPSRSAAWPAVGSALIPRPLRRSGSARARISSRWVGVKQRPAAGPSPAGPPAGLPAAGLPGPGVAGMNPASATKTSKAYVVGPAVNQTTILGNTSGSRPPGAR
jgi:hypothetical protein